MDGGTIPYGNVLAIPATLAIGLLSGAINSGAPSRRRWAFVIGALACATPYLASEDQRILRFVCAVGIVPIVFRNLDLYFDDRSWSLARRMWLLVSIFDSRRASFEPRRVDTHQWLAFVAYALLAAAGAWLCVSSPVTSRDWLLRWLGGAVFAYALMDGAASFSRAAHALFGVRLPPIHNHPILARSVSEFWNRRWNIIVHEMLDRHCFRPLARRGWVRLGMLAAFATSALIHFWIVVPPLGVRWAGVMAAFFAIQGAIVMLERKLAIARLRPGLAHTWTVAALLLSSPLFIEPFVRIMLG